MKQLTLEVIIPTYNGARTIMTTLQSLLGQTKQDFTILIHDDCSTDDTLQVVRSIKDSRIRIIKNSSNLTCQKNLDTASRATQADIVYWLCQDDILSKNALEQTYQAFISDEEIGAVVRPYFWFDAQIDKPVRAISSFGVGHNEKITIDDSYDRIKLFFDAVAQLSGLAYRRKHFEHPFHEDVFPGHAYVFTSILKKHPVIFLADYTVAVRIDSSQTRTVSSIYNKSPIESWVQMFQTLFPEKQFSALREYFIHEFVAINYLGLLQIRNYSTFAHFWREVTVLVKYRKRNLLSPFFLLVVMFCVLVPPVFIIPLIDLYKRKVLAKALPTIAFTYSLKTLE